MSVKSSSAAGAVPQLSSAEAAGFGVAARGPLFTGSTEIAPRGIEVEEEDDEAARADEEISDVAPYKPKSCMRDTMTCKRIRLDRMTANIIRTIGGK